MQKLMPARNSDAMCRTGALGECHGLKHTLSSLSLYHEKVWLRLFFDSVRHRFGSWLTLRGQSKNAPNQREILFLSKAHANWIQLIIANPGDLFPFAAFLFPVHPAFLFANTIFQHHPTPLYRNLLPCSHGCFQMFPNSSIVFLGIHHPTSSKRDETTCGPLDPSGTSMFQANPQSPQGPWTAVWHRECLGESCLMYRWPMGKADRWGGVTEDESHRKSHPTRVLTR